jgi:hypothetical protein
MTEDNDGDGEVPTHSDLKVLRSNQSAPPTDGAADDHDDHNHDHKHEHDHDEDHDEDHDHNDNDNDNNDENVVVSDHHRHDVPTDHHEVPHPTPQVHEFPRTHRVPLPQAQASGIASYVSSETNVNGSDVGSLLLQLREQDIRLQEISSETTRQVEARLQSAEETQGQVRLLEEHRKFQEEHRRLVDFKESNASRRREEERIQKREEEVQKREEEVQKWEERLRRGEERLIQQVPSRSNHGSSFTATPVQAKQAAEAEISAHKVPISFCVRLVEPDRTIEFSSSSGDLVPNFMSEVTKCIASLDEQKTKRVKLKMAAKVKICKIKETAKVSRVKIKMAAKAERCKIKLRSKLDLQRIKNIINTNLSPRTAYPDIVAAVDSALPRAVTSRLGPGGYIIPRTRKYCQNCSKKACNTHRKKVVELIADILKCDMCDAKEGSACEDHEQALQNFLSVEMGLEGWWCQGLQG